MVTHFKENPNPFSELLFCVDLLQCYDFNVTRGPIQSPTNFFSCPVGQESGESCDLDQRTLAGVAADGIGEAIFLEAVEHLRELKLFFRIQSRFRETADGIRGRTFQKDGLSLETNI